MFLLLLAFSLSLSAQITVTCPTATAGQTVTCNASGGTGPYTWSVAGAGSINASSGQYTAPTTVTVQQKVGPCQLLPPDHVFNTRIDALPVSADSGTILGLSASLPLQFQPSPSSNIYTNATPTSSLDFFYTSARNGTFQLATWPNVYVQSGVFTGAFSGVDRHVISVNRETCEFQDIYNFYTAGENGSCGSCTSQSGIKYSNSFALPDTSISNNFATDAASLYLQPLLVRLSDIQSGEIKHAMRFTMANGFNMAQFVWPAKANAAVGCTPTCWKYGMRVRLKSSVDISSFSAKAQIFLLALQRYGMFHSDGGTSYGIQLNADVMLDPTVFAALEEIRVSALRNTDLEVIDESSLATADTLSGAVSLTNGFVTPAQYAEVTATDSMSATGKARVVLAGVVVGVQEPSITIMAGTQVPLSYWVTGSANTAVTFSMSPRVGSISESGVYTAPTGITSPTTTTITITSAAEATAQAFIDVLVWPDNAGGVIRSMPAKTGDFTDAAGHVWYGKTYTRARGWGSPGVWGLGPSNSVYTDTRYSYDDTIFKWYVPNGRYRIRLYTSINTGSGALTSSDFVSTYDSQGVIWHSNWPVLNLVTTARNNGGYTDIPVVVRDLTLYLAIRNLAGTNPYQNVSAIEIVPQRAAPFCPFLWCQ